MDHLPYPKSATISPIEVPFICGHILYSGLSIPDNQSFSSFLKGLPPCEEFYKSNLYHAAEIAQAHVYFGLLRLAVEPPLKVNEWIQRSEASGCQVVTLKLLNTRNWKSRSSRRGWFQWWKTCLVLVLPTVLEHASFIRTHGELGDIIGVSIETLAWTLAEGDRFYTWPRFKEGDILHCRMLDAGWCPYWTEIYCNRLSPPTIYLLSGFPQSQYGNHESCTPDTACRVHDVNPNNYETKHASGCQRQACRFRGPDVLELESIMEEDGIPLIRLSKKKRPRRERQHSPQSLLISTADDDDGPDVAEDTSIELDIVRHTLGRPFIAISHVWAGGLGHFEANTLPECQLRLLFDRARQCKQKRYGLKAFAAVWDVFREEDGDDDDQNVDNFVHNLLSRFVLGTTGEDDSTCYLWIDTLCIPTGDAFADSKTLKQKAINKMAQVYALAMHVLVIDQTVQTLSSKDDSEFAIAGTLLTCPWMTRCWTYQEGCLPRELSFLLNDGVINPREWPPGDQKDEAKDEELCPPGIDVERMLVRECLIDFRNMPDVLNDGARGKQHTQPMSQFIQIWNDLAVRRTTYPEDMHGILAVLLGLSVQEIFQRESGIPRSPSQRMLMVMKAQPSLPLSMLFISYPEDTPLCEDCQWVPKFPAGSLNDDFGSMSWTADSSGLLISLSDTFSHAFILDSQFQSRARDRFRIVTDAKNLPAKSRPSSRIPSKSQKISIPIQLLPSNAQSDDYFWNIRLCFILHGFNGVQTYRGACFSVLESSGSSPLKLNYLCPVSYQVQSQVVEADFTDPSHYTQDYRATVTGSKGDCLLSCGKLQIFSQPTLRIS
jgi:hypothetical protein